MSQELVALDWIVRFYLPAWLRLAGFAQEAESLAAMPEIASLKQLASMRRPLAKLEGTLSASLAPYFERGETHEDFMADLLWIRQGIRVEPERPRRDIVWEVAIAQRVDGCAAGAWKAIPKYFVREFSGEFEILDIVIWLTWSAVAAADFKNTVEIDRTATELRASWRSLSSSKALR